MDVEELGGTPLFSRSFTVSDIKKASTSDKSFVLMDGQQFLGTVIDGKLNLVPVAEEAIVGTPQDVLHKALLCIYAGGGDKALIKALSDIRSLWAEAFAAAGENIDG